MTHPVIPQVLALARPIGESLGLEVVGASFHTNQVPPVLRIDIRHPYQDTGLDDCERMTQALSPALDAVDWFPEAYILEVSSPGVGEELVTDRDFQVFQGFAVQVELHTPYRGRREWRGRLLRRDAEAVLLNQRGRTVRLLRAWVARVMLTTDDQDD
ncbi:MAG: ribosome maturation factor RimP [Gloeomargarita sp. SKYBB_i_bin120]|nr:ribosome maturation factor RimP [Gloeomargarita sp. SKYG98]MCS7293269.1 ribosome maturation factor RimP [Gloeomargarita sp. SKYB120]MDW8178833.1 ribosome maturation factor RimP [Gloeomargarita sp. SKYBB_i_bin120]